MSQVKWREVVYEQAKEKARQRPEGLVPAGPDSSTVEVDRLEEGRLLLEEAVESCPLAAEVGHPYLEEEGGTLACLDLLGTQMAVALALPHAPMHQYIHAHGSCGVCCSRR